MRFITSQFRNLDSREGRFVYMEQDATEHTEGIKDESLTRNKDHVKQILEKPLTGISRLDIDFLETHINLVREGDNENKFKDIVRRLADQDDRNWARQLLRTIEGKTGLKNLITESGVQEKVRVILDRQENEKTIDRVNKILENPLHFTLAGIRFLERVLTEDERKTHQLRIFTEEHRIRFTNLVVYSYESTKATVRLSKVVPPRILLEVSVSKRLWGMLPIALQANLNEIIKQNISEVEKIAMTKDPKTWSKVEVSRICSVYHLLIQRKFPAERMAKISEGLIEWMTYIYERAETLSHGRSIDWSHVSSTEKLLILEIRKLLGDSNFLGGGSTRSGFEELAQQVAQDLVSQKENNPDLLLVWELIEDIPEVRNLSGVDYQKLQQLTEYGNVSRFLQTVEQRGHRILSLVEFQALEEINAAIWEAPDFWDDSSDRMKRRQPIDRKIIQLRQEKNSLSLSDDKEIEKSVSHLREDEPLKTSYFDKKEKRNECFKQVEDVFLELERFFLTEALNPLFADYFSNYKRDLKIEGDLKDIQELLLSIIIQFQTEVNQNKQNVFKQNGQGGQEVVQRQVSFRKLEEVLKKFKESDGVFNKVKEKAQKDLSADNAKKIEGLDAEIKRLGEQYDADTEEEQVIYGLLEYFDPKKQKGVAEEVKQKYFIDLEERVQNHRLHADDLDVLWDRQEGREGFKPSDKQSGSTLVIGLRNQFAEVLLEGKDGQQALINEFQFASTDPETMVQEVEAFFGRRALLETFQALPQWETLVSNPQIRKEIVRGVVQHFRKEIYNVLGSKLPDSVQGVERDKFWNVMRRHFSIREPNGVKRIYERYQSYDQNHRQTNKSIEETRQKHEQITQGYSDEGVRVSEENFDFWSSEVRGLDEKIDDLSLQTSGEQERIGVTLGHFQSKLSALKDQVKVGNHSGIENFVQEWEMGEENIHMEVRSIGRIAADMGIGINRNGEDTFVKEFLDTRVEGQILKRISSLVEVLNSQKDQLSLDSPLWAELSDEFANLRNHLDFNAASGVLRNISCVRHSEMRRQPENIKILNDLGLFDEDGEQKAREKFNKMRIEYDAAFVEFERNAKDVARKVRADISGMSDEDFTEKYGLSKESMEEEMQGYDASCQQFHNVWEDFRRPEFFENWLVKYNGNDPHLSDDLDPVEKARISRTNAIDEFSTWDDITKQVGGMGEFTLGYRKWLDSYDKWKKDNSFLGGLKRIKFQSFSMRSVYEIVKQFMEVVERRRKRREDRAVGNLGGMIFGKTIMGKEFSRMASKAEDERISEWKAGYASEEPWNLREILYKSKDYDEVKACIDLLIEKGFFRWDDPRLLLLFNRLQKNVHFLVPEDLNLPYSELRKKLRGACRGIWPRNADRFREWDGSFEDSLKKAQGIYNKEFSDLEHNKSERKRVLSNMLQQWSRGQVENIDPARYEAYLYSAFEQGKLNGQPDPRWFFLIMGFTVKNPKTGQSILSRRVLDRIQPLMGAMPPVEFFVDNDSYKKDGCVVPSGTPGAKTGPWTTEDFEIWKKMLLSNVGDGVYDFDSSPKIKANTTKFFYQNMLMSSQARGRFDRVQISGQGKIDHDDGAMFAAAWDFETMKKQITEGMDTKGKFTPDFWRNVLQGYDLYFRQMHSYIQEKDQEWSDNPGWQEQKEKILKDVGNRLKAAFMITQALSGNYRQQDAKITLVFDQAKWTEDTPYAANAKNSKDKINVFMDKILDEAGEHKYKTLFDTYADAESNKTFFLKIKEMNSELYTKDSTIFQDTTVVANALNNYVQNTGGSDFFSQAGAPIEKFAGQRKSVSSAWGGLEDYADMKKYQPVNDEEEGEVRRAA